MAKYAQKKNHKQVKQKKKRSFGWFLLGMFLYAAVFLTAAGFGLKEFWVYMEAYENSRPEVAVNAYLEALTDDHICDLSQSVIDQVDHNIQSVEACRAYIKDSISGGVTHAKKSRECTDTRQVYVLRSGTTVIGEFAIEAQQPDEYGFTPWKLAEDSFDFSHLIGTGMETTVPSDYAVVVNGYTLDSSYITVDNIQYEEIADYYTDYALPYRVTYAAPAVLGELTVEIKDSQGNPAVIDENTDLTQFFHNCTQEEITALNTFTEEFVARYVAFTGSSKNTRYGTYEKLIGYVVEGSDMAVRLKDAIEGLQFGQSQSDKIVSIVTHHQVRLEEGKYLCDITYEVDTTGKKGVVRTSTSAKLIIVETDKGLKLESMSIY